MAVDPICGMVVDVLSALRAERDGHAFYFCSDNCRQKFLSTPATVKQEGKPHGKAIYTCPMHPEIEQDHPGTCPKCGMALELKTVAPDVEEDNSELRDMTRRFWIGAALALPVFVVAMAHLVPAWGHAEWVNGNVSRWGQFILSTPVVLWAGWPFFVRGGRSVVNRSFNMFTLIALGVGAAYAFSVVAMLFPRAFPLGAGHGGKPALYFEAPPSSPCWCCLARCSNSARVSAPEAPSKRCWVSPPRQLAASHPTGMKTCRLTQCIRATC